VGARCWAFKLHLPSTYVSVSMYLCVCICVCIHIHIQVCEHLAFRKQKLVLDTSHGQASCLLRIDEPEDGLQDMLRPLHTSDTRTCASHLYQIHLYHIHVHQMFTVQCKHKQVKILKHIDEYLKKWATSKKAHRTTHCRHCNTLQH